MSDEHTVAIVSFMGALKREAKRIRKELQKDESLSEFSVQFQIGGRTHDGDLKLTVNLFDSGNLNLQYQEPKVKGDDINAVVDEFMRRRGWTKLHNPKAISYEKIPSDDTNETSSKDSTEDTDPTDEIPY